MDHEASELEALEHITSDANAEPIKLSYGLLRSITDHFSDEIGRGGFGVVYKGVLQNGDVAVKKLLNLHSLPEKQFLDEIKCLKKAKHKNIVRILGYCSETQGELLEFNGATVMGEAQQKFLCFQYVPNGNIKHYLQQEKPRGDDWDLRYEMIRGICQGLHFLHGEHINHLDLKPENIMLDAQMEPKITDFGLSRCLDQEKSLITQNIFGTLRYIPPETIDRGEISFKSDIYALGIIMIELLTGTDKIYLDNWDELLDDVDCPRVRRCTEIARNCNEPDKRNRPTMFEVIRDLDELEASIIPRTSINQVTPSAFAGTELVGLCPLELSFPFVRNKEMRCHISLTNKTSNLICCLIKPECRDGNPWEEFVDCLPPMHTTAITLRRKPEGELPSDTSKYEIQVLIIGSSGDDFLEQLSTLPYDGYTCMEGIFKVANESWGFELQRATLRAVVIASEDDNRNSVANTACREKMNFCWDEMIINRIDSMDVHPTEPWVLIVTYSRCHTVYVWNWQTNEKMGEYMRWTQGGINVTTLAKFVSRKQWVVIGDLDGSILVHTCPTMDDVKKFKAHHDCVTSLAVHPTRPFLLSFSFPLSMKLWDWSRDWSCNRIFEVVTPVRQVMFDPKHTTMFAKLHEDGIVMMRRIGHTDPITANQLLERPETAFLFTYFGDCRFIAATIGKVALIYDLQKGGQKGARAHTINNRGTIVAVVCHPTLPILVTASADGLLRVWDSITYRLKKVYENLGRYILHIGFTGSGRLVIGHGFEISVLDIDLE